MLIIDHPSALEKGLSGSTLGKLVHQQPVT
jgi:hypothetical protein